MASHFLGIAPGILAIAESMAAEAGVSAPDEFEESVDDLALVLECSLWIVWCSG